MTEHDQRACPRCGTATGDFHFCPSCLAPTDAGSEISIGGALRSESTLTATPEGTDDRLAGHDSAAVAQVENTSVEPPSAPGVELQIRLDGRGTEAPRASRDVARLEDVLSIAPPKSDAPAGDASARSLELQMPRVSVPPPAPREIARLEDVLTVAPADSVEIAPKTAAGAVQHVEPAQDEAEVVAEENAAPPAAEVQPLPAAAAPRLERTWVPAYALRAAFWFEQVSAFESSSEDDEEDELPPAAAVPQVDPVAIAAESPMVQAEPEPGTPQASRNWLFGLCLLALVALVLVLAGRCPRGCASSKTS